MAVHLFLEGRGPEPFAHYLQRMATEFHCRPSEVLIEQQRLPAGLLHDLIEARRYGEWKRAYDADNTLALTHPWAKQVKEIEFELVEQANG